MNERLLVVLGPTATGKTRFAVRLAARVGGEIISADSRQVYRGMDIGTGKDLVDYEYEGRKIPYHLIDIVEAGERYNVFRYQNDFFEVYRDVISRGAVPLLCGGSGMYIEAVCSGYHLPEVPENTALRKACEQMTHDDLMVRLASFGALHNTTDTESRKRLIRAIEIAEYRSTIRNPVSQHTGHSDRNGEQKTSPLIYPYIVGLKLPLEERRARINRRLTERLQNGLVEEIEQLMNGKVTVEDMMYYGLEYKYIALYLTGILSFEEMKEKLRIAIHQFAKRQMTWFRGMERRGLKITWIDALGNHEEAINEIIKSYRNEM
jgi:tRNA dimethylallyltransferase